MDGTSRATGASRPVRPRGIHRRLGSSSRGIDSSHRGQGSSVYHGSLGRPGAGVSPGALGFDGGNRSGGWSWSWVGGGRRRRTSWRGGAGEARRHGADRAARQVGAVYSHHNYAPLTLVCFTPSTTNKKPPRISLGREPYVDRKRVGVVNRRLPGGWE